MDITIIKQEKKPLVGREEIEAQVTTYPTPSNNQVQEELAKKLNKNPELVVIKHIYSKFGSHENKIIAYIYDNQETLKKFEPKSKEKKEKKPKPEKPEQIKPKSEQKPEKKEEKLEIKEIDKVKGEENK
jgi:ribosomal protein S24E